MLYDFQKEDLEILCNNNRKVLLAHEMGLGKTHIAINYLKRTMTTTSYILIITPLYLQDYWVDKIKLIIGDCNIFINQFTIKGPGIYFLNYDKLKNYSENYLRDWDVLILDEANYIKNRKTARFKAIKKLKYNRILMLTGTPMQNNVTELWTLLNLAGLKSSYWEFVGTFAKTVPVPWGTLVVGIQHEKTLNEILNSIMIRRLRADVINDLPSKTYEVYKLPMLPKQEILYNKIKDVLKDEILPIIETTNGSVFIDNILVKMLRLKQIADDASIIEPSFKLTEASNKIIALDEFLETHNRKGIMIFTQFKDFEKTIAKRYGFSEINGDVAPNERYAILQKLNNRELSVVATTQSVTYGVDIPNVNYEIFMDKLYNPAQNLQAEDRGFRIIRKENLPIVEFRSKNSIDDYIFRMNQNKLSYIKEILGE